MPLVFDLNIPSWGTAPLEVFVDENGNVLSKFFSDIKNENDINEYLTFTEYENLAREFPSVLFFFSAANFPFLVFSAMARKTYFTSEMNDTLQEFIYAVHNYSLAPKSIKATRLAREIRPLRRIATDAGYDDIEVAQIILEFVINNPFSLEPSMIDKFHSLISSVKAQPLDVFLTRKI